MTGPGPAVVTAAVTGTSALVRDRAGALRFFGVPGGELLAAFEPGTVELAAIAADGGAVAVLERGGDVRVVGGAGVPAQRPAPYARALAVAGDGRTVAVAGAGSPGRLELFRDGEPVASADLGDVGRARLHADETLGVLAVETAAGAGDPVLRAAFRFDGRSLEPFWQGVEEASVAGPALGGALYLRGPRQIVRRAPDQPDRTAPGTPADLLAATPDGSRMLAARPLEYQADTARALLRVLDATSLEELARDEAPVGDWSATRLVVTSELEILALRADPEGGLAVSRVGSLAATPGHR